VDNAKKLIEDGTAARLRCASITGDTVGDPTGHRRPGHQPHDQDHEHRGDPDHPLIIKVL
jgi:hypothetical protein